MPDLQPADHDGVYGISVAAELTGIGVQNIRAYERQGLLTPARTDGGTRRFSKNDLDRLRRIRAPLPAGLNLAGIVMVIQLETENAELRGAAILPPRPTAAHGPQHPTSIRSSGPAPSPAQNSNRTQS